MLNLTHLTNFGVVVIVGSSSVGGANLTRSKCLCMLVKNMEFGKRTC